MGYDAVLWLLLLCLAATAVAAPPDRYAEARRRMIDVIADTARRTQTYTGRSRFDQRVMDALARVPRHEFVPPEIRDFAYEDRPLPIGRGQTISQPFIVALMTDLAALEPGDVVLEIGTGSGYQAAVLATLAREVYTIEIIPELGRRAEDDLHRLGYTNVTVRVGDGYAGWPERAPFDAILVTAAPEAIPPPLLDQLRPGGRLVIPVGTQGAAQSLKLLRKNSAGRMEVLDVLPVGFVPLIREP